jgi:hypothetical protein
MGNTYVTEQRLAEMSLIALTNNNLALNLFRKWPASEALDKETGGVINVKKPLRFKAERGVKRVSQAIKQETVPVNVNQHLHVSWETNLVDMTLSQDPKKLYKEVVEKAMIPISTTIDCDAMALALDIPNAVGTPGTAPSTFLALGQVAERLMDESAPEGAKLIISQAAQTALSDALSQAYFNEKMVSDMVRKKYLGDLANMQIFVSQNLKRLTVGVPGGTPVVNGANQTGDTIAVSGLSASGTYKKGDIVTFTGCNAVNPVNYIDLNYLRRFVVREDFTASGGAGNLKISPKIITSGAYQTCTASPTTTGAVTLITSSNHINNIAFVEDAFTIVTAPIKLPDMEGIGKTFTKDGISVTVTKQFDIDMLCMVYRIDVLYAIQTMYETLACRLFG